MVPVQHIAITLESGALYVMAFVLQDERQGWIRLPTPENVDAEIAKASADWPSPWARWRLIDSSDLPNSREFRESWMDTGGAIVHDMARARAIGLDRIRTARGVRLAELDKEWMRASGQKDNREADRVEAKRQVLRDFPASIAATLEACQTIEGLKAIKLPE